MDEAKAAAYYDELTRKGGGAARFKQGLGFSTSSSSDFTKPADSRASFYSSFVRASTTGHAPDRPEPQDHRARADGVRRKLTKNASKDAAPTGKPDRESRRSRSRERRDEEYSRSGRYYGERRSRSSRGSDRDYGHRERRRRSRTRSRSRSRSPLGSRSGSRRDHSRKEEDAADGRRSKKADVDYSRLIEGYSRMTPAEKVKAKMKLQLSRTAEKDMAAAGNHTGWERFDFNKDAPLDDENDDEIEAAEDDVSLVENRGKSFRFSAIQAKREDEIRAAHDQAMFGAPVGMPVLTDEEPSEQTDAKEVTVNPLLNEKVAAMQQGSWRDRVRRK